MATSIRRQVGALPYRFDEDGTLRILLITSRRAGKWIIPKGNLMKRLAPHDAAAREAYEEAGAIGQIEPDERGHYLHRKRRKAGRRVRCRVGVHAMEVTARLDRFPERDQRASRWFSADDARQAIRNPTLRRLVALLLADLAATAPGQAPA